MKKLLFLLLILNFNLYSMESKSYSTEYKFKAYDGPVLALAITPDGKKVVSGSLDNDLFIWDPFTGEKLDTLNGQDSRVTRLVISTKGFLIGSEATDGKVRIWDLKKDKLCIYESGNVNELLCMKPKNVEIEGYSLKLPNGDKIQLPPYDYTAAAALDDNIIITGHSNGNIKTWIKTSRVARRLKTLIVKNTLP